MLELKFFEILYEIIIKFNFDSLSEEINADWMKDFEKKEMGLDVP